LRIVTLRRIGVVSGALVAILAGTAGAATAHAALIGTSPSQSTHYAAGAPPNTVTVTFDDDVTTTAKAIGVYDGSGHGVRVVPVHTADKKVVQARLPKLSDGSYAVVWHIVSDDGHPETGAFTFSVGTATASTTDIGSLEASRTSGRGIGMGFGVDRAIEFFACLTLVGALMFGRWRWPAVLARRDVRRMLLVISGVGLLAALASIPLEAAYSSGTGASALFDGSALGVVVKARFGVAALIRAGMIVALAGYVLAPVAGRRGARVAAETPLALLGLGVGATFAYAGHGFTGRWLVFGFVLDVTHLTAASVWLGGVVLLGWGLRTQMRAAEGATALNQFSRIALPAIGVVVLSGVLQGWRQIGTWSALWHTSYARLLIIKVLVVLAIVVIASAGRDALRDWLRTRERDAVAGPEEPAFSGPSRPSSGSGGGSGLAVELRTPTAVDLLDFDTAEDERLVRDVRRGVLLEAGLAIVVLAVTSALVVTPPSREAEAAARIPQAQTVHLAVSSKTIGYNVAVQPTLVGQNTIVVDPHLIGRPGLLPTSLTGSVRGAPGSAATRVSFTALANGEWVAVAPFGQAGTWTVNLIGATPSASETATFHITVR
jgi:copper transport protein